MRNLILLLIVAAFTQCSFPVADLFFDPDIVDQDTTETQPVIVVDTCHELVYTPDTAFVVLGTYFFNGIGTNPVWHYDQFSFTSTNLIELLEFYFPQFDYTYYESETGVIVFVDGTNNNNLFQGKIWTTDLIGQRQLLTANGQWFYLYGALEFEEAMYEVSHRSNIVGFGFFGNEWTEEQNNAYSRQQLRVDICKHGEIRANFHYASTPIQQSIKDSFELFEWQQVVELWSDEVPISK